MPDHLDVHVYLHGGFSGSADQKLDALIALVTKGFGHMDQELADLAAQAKANTDAEAAAVLVMNGIAAAIAKAVAAAQAAGATPAQLAQVTALQASLAASAAPLAAAVVAGTSAEA